MAITIGSLVIELKANTASFIEGMDKVSHLSLNTAKNIEKAFATLGASLAGIATLVEGTVVEMVNKSAESAAHIWELSQAAGMSVESLSSMGYAARQEGQDLDSFASGIEKLSKNMRAAAIAPKGTVNAFNEMGIAVTDASGKLRDPAEVLLEVSAHFAKMKNGAEKTALAIALFGKSGAGMIPTLNHGREGLKELTDESDRLGKTLSTKTAADAKEFEDNLTRLHAAAEGLANRLMADVVPSLNVLEHNMEQSAQGGSENWLNFLKVVAGSGKVFVIAFGAVQTFFDDLGNWFQGEGAKILSIWDGLIEAMKKAGHGDFSGAWTSWTQGLKNADEAQREMASNSSQIWREYREGVAQFWKDSETRPAPGHGNDKDNSHTPPPTADRTHDYAQRRIAQLKQQFAGEMSLVTAQDLDLASLRRLNEEKEAGKTISDLELQLGQYHLKLTQDQKAAIEQLTRAKGEAAALVSFRTDLQKQNETMEDSIAGTQRLASATLQGAAAVREAERQNKLLAYERTHDMGLLNENVELEAMMVDKQGHATKQLADYKASIVAARQAWQQYQDGLDRAAKAQDQLNFAKATDGLNDSIRRIQDYTAAVLAGAGALREFDVEQKVQQMRDSNPSLSEGELADYAAQLRKLQDVKELSRAADRVASQESYKRIGEQIQSLQALRDLVVQHGGDTKAIDDLLHQDRIREMQDYDSLLLKVGGVRDGFRAFFNEYTMEATSAAKQVYDVLSHTFDSLESELTQLITTGKADFGKMLKDMEQQATKAVMHDVLSSAMKKLGGLFGLHTGDANKPDGTKNNPLYVTNADVLGGGGTNGILGGLFGLKNKKAGLQGSGDSDSGNGGDANGGMFSKITSGFQSMISKVGGFFTGLFGKIGNSFGSLLGGVTKLFSGIGSIFGKALGGIGSLFGGISGFLAGGGDVFPGRSYIVGERRPERFTPKVPGTIHPTADGAGAGGPGFIYAPVYNLQTPNADSFRKSQSQIIAEGYASMRMAHARANG